MKLNFTLVFKLLSSNCILKYMDYYTLLGVKLNALKCSLRNAERNRVALKDFETHCNILYV